jgi:hypothetical protein
MVRLMNLKFSLIAVAFFSVVASSQARAESFIELVAKEEGVAFGPCVLTPRPKLAGKEIHVVIPSRFAQPGIWTTRTILFVAIDEAENIQGMVEAKALDDVPPREVVSVVCNKNALTIRLPKKTLSYLWDGDKLRRK